MEASARRPQSIWFTKATDMKAPSQAIRVARINSGWTWALVGDQGQIAARGAAAEQQDAMAAAWRTARAVSDGESSGYPEIIVELGARSVSGATPTPMGGTPG